MQEGLRLQDHVCMPKAYVDAFFPCYPRTQQMPLLVWIEVDGLMRRQPHTAYLTPKRLQARRLRQAPSHFDMLKLPVARRDVGSLHGMFHLGWLAAGHGLPVSLSAARAAAVAAPGVDAQVVMVLSTRPQYQLPVPGTALSPCTGQQLPAALYPRQRTAIQHSRTKAAPAPAAGAAAAAVEATKAPAAAAAQQSGVMALRGSLDIQPSPTRELP